MEPADRLANILRTYRSRQCVLFAGAGFSADALSHDLAGKPQNVPTGRKLVAFFKDALGEDSDDLSSLADLYQHDKGEYGLFQLLKAFYVATSVTPTQTTISNYPWKEIYTTNYDNVVELALSSTSRPFSIYNPTKRPSDVDYRTLPIVHINGFIESADFKEFRNEIKLTDAQYFSDDFSRSAWGERFRNDIITSPCIVFAGYSLYDLDVARVINTFEGMKERIFFIVGDTVSRSLERKLSQFGTILPIGIDGLAKIIDDIDLTNATPPKQHLSAWEAVNIPTSAPRAFRDIDVVNFLMSGSVDSEQFAYDLLQKDYKLAINRECTDYIVDNISRGIIKNTILYSNVGNGKTNALESIAYKLASRNISTFRSTSSASLLLKELSVLRQIEGRIALIIDDGFSNIDLIKAIVSIGRDDIAVIVTARTSQVELQEGTIRNAFGNEVELFRLDELTSGEVASIVEFMDRYALWGTRQNLSPDQKRGFVQRDCSSELRFVILSVLNSPNIKSRIQSIIDVRGTPESRDRVRSVLVLSQLLNLAEVRPDLSLISELLGFDARSAIRDHSTTLRDFSLIRNGVISIRSSIFAEYVIQQLIDTASVIATLISAMNRLDVIFDNSATYGYIFKNFSRFRFIETTIAPEKRLVHMIKYFEEIKELKHSRDNPLFWLQYAMSRLSLKQFPEADRLFDVAYSYSKRAGYIENRHLNNQYARFLLESRTESNNYTDFMSAFNRAHAICVKQMVDDPHAYNPYRVAQNYQAFLERRVTDLKDGDLVAVIRSCSEIAKFCASRTGMTQRKGVIDHCAASMRATAKLAREVLASHGVTI